MKTVDVQGIEIPWGEIGHTVYKRTYARRLNDSDANGETEEFEQTIERVVKACRTQLKVGFTPEEEEKLRRYSLEMKGSVAGRFLWQLGTKTVGTLGLASLQNCSATVVDEPIRPFTWAMDNLMLGSGVGFNIQREYVYQLPTLQKKKVKIQRVDDASADYIIPDTREGWVKLLGKVLKAHFFSGEGFTYSTQLIRGHGASIKGFGGVASGPEILVEGMELISKVLDARRGKKVRPIDCLDIVCIIGMIVVAGNVRRSAIIAIGDCDDLDYLRAKRWDLGNIPNWRANSNNSVACDSMSQLPEEFWEGYKGNGEPYGFINFALSREQGRSGETQYPDPDVVCYNPCGEQGLAKYETCCLSETFLPNITSLAELIDVVKIFYRINKHSLTLRCHNKETEEVVHKNMRMGIGVTGYATSTEEQRSWLPAAYEALRAYDKEYSAEHGFPESIKLTTTKPAGTLSLLPGVSAGVHPAFSRYYIRRMRIASSSPLVEECRKAGYPIEYLRNLDGTEDHRTQVVEFPCSFPEGSIFADDPECTAVSQLENVRRLQRDWSDNSVSVTIYYQPEELDEIRAWLEENYTTDVKTVSFLLASDHGFDQAPLEKISKEEFDKRVLQATDLESVSFNEDDISEDQIGCVGGACPVK